MCGTLGRRRGCRWWVAGSQTRYQASNTSQAACDAVHEREEAAKARGGGVGSRKEQTDDTLALSNRQLRQWLEKQYLGAPAERGSKRSGLQRLGLLFPLAKLPLHRVKRCELREKYTPAIQLTATAPLLLTVRWALVHDELVAALAAGRASPLPLRAVLWGRTSSALERATKSEAGRRASQTHVPLVPRVVSTLRLSTSTSVRVVCRVHRRTARNLWYTRMVNRSFSSTEAQAPERTGNRVSAKATRRDVPDGNRATSSFRPFRGSCAGSRRC